MKKSLEGLESDPIESRIQKIGAEIFRLSQLASGLPARQRAAQKMMQWSMQHPQLKTEMFRFVDVLPALNRSEQIVSHLREYFLDSQIVLPFFLQAGLKLSLSNPFTDKILALLVRKNVAMMAEAFITGKNSSEAQSELKRLWDAGYCFTVDILGEAVVSEKEASVYQSRYLELVVGLSELVKSWSAASVLENAGDTTLPRANISVKCSSLYSQMSVLAFDRTVDVLKDRLRPILRAAIKHQAFIYLDMEQNDYRDIILTVAEDLFMEEDFRCYPHFGLVLQAYLKSAREDVERVIRFAQKRGAELSVRLVKGAYWDYENIISSQRDWTVPVFATKMQTDANYEACTADLIKGFPHVRPAFASHNVRSLSHAMALCEQAGLGKTDFEIQMLYGMAHDFKHAVRSMGYRVREYAPVGELLPGMAYLVRRLLENTSNEGFLKQSHFDHKDVSLLLRKPKPDATVLAPMIHSTKQRFVMIQNQSPMNFALAENRNWIEAEFSKIKKSLPRSVPVVVNGEEVPGLDVLEVRGPFSETVVSRISLSDQTVAEQAIQTARTAKIKWSDLPVSDRAAVIRRAADLLESRRNALMSLMVFEVGKTLTEADADVCEAIDFCRYYAACAEDLMSPHLTSSILGETNHYLYQPRGLAVAIAPWNFPIAILCGMTVAPLVCGNAVIMKPAEQSSTIAYELYSILREAGVPACALQFLPGLGETVGKHLVQSKDVHVISFTGSRDVGLSILRASVELSKGQTHIKKVVAEMGGKNAVIIDGDADLDEAVQGCLYSAFGFSGQKCSALSRILVHKDIYDKFKERFIEGLQAMKLGLPTELDVKIGPVIDRDTQKRLLAVIQKHKKCRVAELKVSDKLMAGGCFVPPTVFESTDFSSELGQQEFFGPLVTLFRVDSIDEAVTAMNSVDYALTGGLYSRSPKTIEYVKRNAEVGNLYINRGITGAVVCRQPFGGFKLSGVGGKAGGPDYLLHFLEPRTVTENTMRRGFSPDLSGDDHKSQGSDL